MATGNRPDPSKRKTNHAHATNFKVGNGCKDAGYKAGELFGCYGHRTHAHQPCALMLTNHKVQCPYCASGLEQVFRAYVPLYDRDWTLRYALIGEDIFDSVDAIPFRACVVLSRGKNPISPLIIREELALTRALPDRDPWNKPVSMLDVCLTLWKIDALTEWFKKNPLPSAPSSDKPVSLPKGTAVRPDGTPYTPPLQAAAKRYGADVVDVEKPVSAALEGALERARAKEAAAAAPSSNGQHRKPKKE